MRELKLIPDAEGEVTLIEKFWKDDKKEKKIVHHMLIYADLIEDPDPRYLETANKIYKHYVENNL